MLCPCPRRLLGVALTVRTNLICGAQTALLREKIGEGCEILLLHASNDPGHDGVLAFAALVIPECLYEVVGMLTSERRILT